MPAGFRTTRIVEFGDTDMAGIVHFANFFRFMEAAEHAFLRSLGLSVVMEIDGGNYGLPRASAACDYLRPARFGEPFGVWRVGGEMRAVLFYLESRRAKVDHDPSPE